MINIIETAWQWAYPLYDRKETTLIILHHAAASNASAELIHECHLAKGWTGIAYHYYVRKDGSIYRGRPEHKKGGHTGDHNHNSIGICFEGNFEVDTMSDVQTEAGAALVADILSRYGELKIIGHRDVNPTACPGKNFRMDDIKEGFMSYATFKKHMERYEAEKAAEPVSAYAEESCRKAVRNKIFADGTGDGSVDYPQSPLKRQEFAAILDRLGMLE